MVALTLMSGTSINFVRIHSACAPYRVGLARNPNAGGRGSKSNADPRSSAETDQRPCRLLPRVFAFFKIQKSSGQRISESSALNRHVSSLVTDISVSSSRCGYSSASVGFFGTAELGLICGVRFGPRYCQQNIFINRSDNRSLPVREASNTTVLALACRAHIRRKGRAVRCRF